VDLFLTDPKWPTEVAVPAEARQSQDRLRVARQEPARAIKRLNGGDLDLVLDLDLYLESREKSVAKVAPLRLVATIVAVDEVADIAAEDADAADADADADAACAGVWSEDTLSMLLSAEVGR